MVNTQEHDVCKGCFQARFVMTYHGQAGLNTQATLDPDPPAIVICKHTDCDGHAASLPAESSHARHPPFRKNRGRSDFVEGHPTSRFQCGNIAPIYLRQDLIMPLRRTAWKNLKQAQEWACVIGAPAGQVHFVCPECQTRTAILKVGPFECPLCQTPFVAAAGAITPTYHRFVIRRALTRATLPAEAQR